MVLFPLIANAKGIEIDGLKFDVVNKTKEATVTGLNASVFVGTDVVIPETVTYEDVSYVVKRIGDNAFYNLRGMTSVSIPRSINSIGKSAFGYCGGLKAVYITDIGAWCKIIFNDSPLRWAKHLYLNGEEVKTVVLPNDLKKVNAIVFNGCASLEKVVLHDSIDEIGNGAFLDCINLKTIEIPNSVKVIEAWAFGRSGLTSIVIPNSVYTIGDYVFSGCSSLSSVQLPNTITSIGKEWFEECTNLTSVNIPETVSTIDVMAFYKCTNLLSINLHENIKKISENSFGYCSSLQSVSIPNQIETIEEGAFRGCSSITSVVIPECLTNIPKNLFRGCTNLKEVYLHSNVKQISSYAFGWCESLSDVFCHAETPPTCEEKVFYNSYIDYTKLHVPSSSIIIYKETEPWKSFGDVVAMTDTGIDGTKKTTEQVISHYTLEGRLISAPIKGINIIRMSNGKTKKIFVK